MGAAYFYHLTDSPLEVALPLLIDRALGAGWKVAVRAPDQDRLENLDKALWAGPDDGFLAHGLAGGAQDALQPVLLCRPGQAAGNGAACLMATGGVEVSAQDVAEFERLCVVFDGMDDTAVATARSQWKALADAGCALVYWAQQESRWIKKAEVNVAA